MNVELYGITHKIANTQNERVCAIRKNNLPMHSMYDILF